MLILSIILTIILIIPLQEIMNNGRRPKRSELLSLASYRGALLAQLPMPNHTRRPGISRRVRVTVGSTMGKQTSLLNASQVRQSRQQSRQRLAGTLHGNFKFLPFYL